MFFFETHCIYIYIHFISPNIGSNNTQNIHRRTHTLTHTSIHTNNIYTHTTIYIRGGVDPLFHALDKYKPNFHSNLCMRLAHRTLVCDFMSVFAANRSPLCEKIRIFCRHIEL